MQEVRAHSRRLPVLGLVHHVANEGSGSRKRGLLLKECGVLPGIPDYALDSPRIRPDGGIYHGWRGELKRLFDSYPSPAERDMLAFLTAQGYRADWFKGHGRMLADLLWYVGLPEVPPDAAFYLPFDYPPEPAKPH